MIDTFEIKKRVDLLHFELEKFDMNHMVHQPEIKAIIKEILAMQEKCPHTDAGKVCEFCGKELKND